MDAPVRPCSHCCAIMSLHVVLPPTQGAQGREERAPHLCTVLMADNFTTSLALAAALLSPGEIRDVWVVEVEASEELREVLVGSVSVGSHVPGGGEQESLQTILS